MAASTAKPIIESTIWEKTDELLHAHAARARGQTSKSMCSPLAGKLFDESGRPLTPSHAVKGKRRYRYYVSRGLMTGRENNRESAWRLPAAEFERRTASVARTILADRSAIAGEIEQSRFDASQTKSILETASAWSSRLQSDADASEALSILVDRVELNQNGIRISLKMPLTFSENFRGPEPVQLTLTRDIPLQMRRRGVELRFIVDGNTPVSARVEPALIKLVSREHRWFDDL
jgi:site-specific DNA recombinase